jgi:hypothetical protein
MTGGVFCNDPEGGRRAGTAPTSVASIESINDHGTIQSVINASDSPDVQVGSPDTLAIQPQGGGVEVFTEDTKADLNLHGRMSVNGPSMLLGDVGIGFGSGENVPANLAVNGGISATGNANVTGPVSTGNLTVNGSATTDTLTVNTDASTPHLQVNGDIDVTGDVKLSGGDCAEDFDIANSESVDAGTVMVIDDEGALQPSCQAYDKRVAGVISGAGNLRPGVILGKQSAKDGRMPLALVGKVYCKVDADCSSIRVGDLLTTSPTPGHAMKAKDQALAFGAVIGKALSRLDCGKGLIPVLVALQ